jgi:PhzF family phenazine biosynthesis protein
MTTPLEQRWTAFSDDPQGGNPAGVVTGADDLDAMAMQQIAARIGYAETAFITGEGRVRRIRYFSPIAEVPFCGHATIASAVALAVTDGPGLFTFDTPVGPVEITTSSVGTNATASFTSVAPAVQPLAPAQLDTILALIGLGPGALDPTNPPRLAYAGNWHPLIVLADADAFDSFSFDASDARALLDAQGWTATITVLRHKRDDTWEARNIFPVGAIVEDPATGSAAAATGAYLRATGAVVPPARVLIEQGRHVGRPGLLIVDVPREGGITVTGSAVPIGPDLLT